MKRNIIITSVVLLCVCTSILCAEPNEPNSISVTDPNNLTEPNLPEIIEEPELLPGPAETKNIPEPSDLETVPEPNEPNSLSAPIVPAITKNFEAKSITISPAVELPQFKYRLLPLQMENKDGDAAEMYIKAIHLLPENFDRLTMADLLKAPADKFNSETAEKFLNSTKESQNLIARAALLRDCNWSLHIQAGKSFSLLEGLNTLTSLLDLRTRLANRQGRYNNAVETIRDGLAMSRHIVKTSSLVQAMAAVNTASVMLKNLEQTVQSPNAPSLYRSLSDLPRPLIDLNKPIAMAASKYQSELTRNKQTDDPFGKFDFQNLDKDNFIERINQLQLETLEQDQNKYVEKPSYTRKELLLQMNRLDRHVAALQCLEGIRYYAAVNKGSLPESLNDISDLSMPLDPVTQRPFRYMQSENMALLGSPVTRKQADCQSTIYYLIKKQNPETGE